MTAQKTLEQLAKDDIFNTLRSLYPNEPGTVLLGWVDKVYDHDPDFKLPETPLMEAYRRADADEKEAKERKEKLRKDLIKQFKDIDHPIKGVDFREDTRITWKQDALFDWVATSFPQFLNDVRATAIDITKLEDKVASLHMTMPPDTCYTETEIKTITVDHGKKKQ